MNPLGAIGASSSVIFLILGFCNGCTGGFGIPIAQCFGAKDYSNMRLHVSNARRLSLTMSILIAAITCFMCARIMKWMLTPDEIFHDAWIYLFVTFAGIPFTMTYNLEASILRAVGDSKTPFYFLLLASVLNVILDLCFILVLNWGVEGAALATVTSQGISALLCYNHTRRRFAILKAQNASEKRIDTKACLNLLNMGVPMGLQFSITAIGSIMLQTSNNALGTACVTAFTAGMRLKMFFMCPLENIGVAMATYCGQNLGAKKISRLWKGVKDSMLMCGIYYIIVLIGIQIFAKDLSKLFIYASETDILNKSALFLHVSTPFYIILGLLCVLRYSLQGVGYTKLSIMSGVFEMVARIAVSLTLVPALGFFGVCIGDPTAWVAANIFLIPAFFFVYKSLKRKYEN